MTDATPSAYELQQCPDGVWHAVPAEGAGAAIDHIGGWNHLAELLRENTVCWCSPTDLSRFRSQYGEPPPGLDLSAMQVAGDG